MASSAEPPAKKAKLDEQERQKALERAQEEYTAIEKKLEVAYSKTHQEPAMIDFLRTALQNRQDVLMNLTSQKAEVSEAVLSEVRKIVRQEVNELKRGFLGSEIIIDSRIPEEFLGERAETLKASSVGRNVNLTSFLKAQVIKSIDEDWKPFDMPAEAVPNINNTHDLKQVVEKAGLGYMSVENDNQFNRKVNIRDSSGESCHFCSRVDGLILANKELADSKKDSIENIMQFAVAFVEIENDGKGMEASQIQLLSSMMAIATSIQKKFLYGVVINKTFDQARLVKFYFECCCADGCFHPAALGKVANLIMSQHP